ncbi:MAG: site-specific integrase [Gallionellaceae bacterium]|nr:site-specific integrase [Gallionellaceae bacterium]
MATIRKRGELQWQAIVKRKGWPVLRQTFPTKKEAQAWAGDREKEIRSGLTATTHLAEITTLGELAQRYRVEVLPTKRGHGFSPALAALNAALGKYALIAITSKRVAEYRDGRLKAGYAAATVKKELNLLSRLIDLAGKEWGIPVPANPCAMVSRPRENNARERRLENDEEGRLLAACSVHMRLLIQLAVETAARLGELLSLQWKDIDLEKRVMVVRGLTVNGTQETKNKDPYRVVPLSPAAVKVLQEVKALPLAISGRVFYWWRGSDSFNKSWRRACDRAGIENLKFHDLRHEATSRLFERGVFDSMEVASITGHKTLAMLKRYTHLKAEELAKKLG